MSKNLNKVMVIGNVGTDPQIQTTKYGIRVATLSIATNSNWTDNTNQVQQHTEWHRVVFYKNVVDFIENYIKRGTRLYVEGSIRTNKWQDESGNQKSITQIQGRELILLDSNGPQPPSWARPPTHRKDQSPPINNDEIIDGEIPF